MSVEKILDIRAEILNSYTSGTKDVTQIDELLTKYREAVEELSKLHQPTVRGCLHPFDEVVSGDDGDFCCKCQTYLKSNRL